VIVAYQEHTAATEVGDKGGLHAHDPGSAGAGMLTGCPRHMRQIGRLLRWRPGSFHDVGGCVVGSLGPPMAATCALPSATHVSDWRQRP
jgi:hypothetical protein